MDETKEAERSVTRPPRQNNSNQEPVAYGTTNQAVKPCTNPGALAVGSAAPGLEPMLLRYPEAARFLAIGERALWSLANRGEIPSVRIGKKCVRFRRETLERWVAEREADGAGVRGT